MNYSQSSETLFMTPQCLFYAFKLSLNCVSMRVSLRFGYGWARTKVAKLNRSETNVPTQLRES